MTASTHILLDEHVSRIFERLLKERGYRVNQAKDSFGEHTRDAALLRWCGKNNAILVTNNAKDFEQLHRNEEHAGILLYYDQGLPDNDPEGLARVIDVVIEQYGQSGLANEIVDLGEWYRWHHS